VKLIKSASVYQAHLPQSINALEEHLSAKPFVELGATDFAGAGFVPPVEVTGALAVSFEGGYAFAVRYDEKIVPASVTSAEAKKRITAEEEECGFRLGKKRRQEIREYTFHDLLTRALTRTKVVQCYFVPTSNLLIVPTTSKKLADTITGELVKVMGSLKATTIYVSEAKASLTTRLSSYLAHDYEDQPVGAFEVGSKCKLRSSDGRRFSFDLSADLIEANDGIQEAVRGGGLIEEIELLGGDMSFRLTSDFKLKGIDPGVEPAKAGDFDDALDLWQHEASIQVAAVDRVVRAVCELLDYKEPEQQEAPETAFV